MTMNEYKVLGTIWFWALIALIIALHACTRLLCGRKAEIIPAMCEADVSELF